uniref:glycosyltransferase family 4 protein n=1 Tax=Flavobacterium sp. TaxID=239 RepID=UPI00404AF0E6
MKIAIITHVNHYQEQNQYFAYAPYVREMNIWVQFVDEVIVVAPLEKKEKTAIDIPYEHNRVVFKKIPAFNVTNTKAIIKTVVTLPSIFYTVFKAMKQANHIHLRCPGNMGLIGAFVQILFPSKPKTAKYAGNWDPKSKQPWSYKLQKYILSNTFLTKNIQVLVYGEWPNQTKNNKPFFTATYAEKDKKEVEVLKLDGGIQFLFVGTLAIGKQPLYAIQLIEQLHQLGYKVNLDVYGEGILRKELEKYIADKHLEGLVHLKGNQTKENVEKAYQENHFLVLPSKSEGWPKVVAEAMFWGCVPLVTPVSCVPYMVDFGKRGVLLQMNLDEDIKQIKKLLLDDCAYQEMSKNGRSWSQHYTTDFFEKEIQKLLNT